VGGQPTTDCAPADARTWADAWSREEVVETTPGSASGQWALCANLIVTNDRRRRAWRLEVEKRMFAVLVTG